MNQLRQWFHQLRVRFALGWEISQAVVSGVNKDWHALALHLNRAADVKFGKAVADVQQAKLAEALEQAAKGLRE